MSSDEIEKCLKMIESSVVKNALKETTEAAIEEGVSVESL